MKRSLAFVLIGLLVASIMSISCAPEATRVRVATSTSYPPFTYIDDQSDQLVGFDIDLMNAIAQKEKLEIEFIEVEFKLLIEGMAQDKYDAAISNISITEERKKDMLFSEPYFIAGHVVTARADNSSITGKESLPGRVVGVLTGSTSAADAGKIQGVTIKSYAEYGPAFKDLMDGLIDAVISDNTIARNYVSENTDKLRIAGDPFTKEYYGIAVAKNNSELLSKINAGLEAVKSEGLLEELTQKWL